MSKSIEKVRKDETNNIILAVDPNIIDDGSPFEISSGEITTTTSYKTGLGLFEGNFLTVINNTVQEVSPTNDLTRNDEIFELDENNDLTPKE